MTVGSIHGGTRPNIIPGEVILEVSVRSLSDEVRQHLLSAIQRITKAEAAAAGAPREPLVEVSEGGYALVNDPALTQRVAAALVRELGPQQVMDTPPEMVSEDFSEFQRAGVPTLMLRIGAVEQRKVRRGDENRGRAPLPALGAIRPGPRADHQGRRSRGSDHASRAHARGPALDLTLPCFVKRREV